MKTDIRISRSSLLRTIFVKEMRDLLRDRRAVFCAFFLPLLLYPFLFWLMASLPEESRNSAAERNLLVGVSGDLRGMLRHLEPADKLTLRLQEFRADDVRGGEVAAFIDLRAPDELGTTPVVLHYMPSSPSSVAAADRVEKLLERWSREEVEKRFSDHGVRLKVDEVLKWNPIDVATGAEKQAASLGRILPALFLLLIISGGAFAAIDLVAGEKERGTLETLAVQPISSRDLIAGKFFVVFTASIASILFNMIGLVVATQFGWAPAAMTGLVSVHLPWQSLATMFLLLIPIAVLMSAALLAISAYAKSYREAQTYLMPMTLILFLPLGLAGAPQVRLDGLIAIIPITNVAVAIRDCLGERLEWSSVFWVLSSSMLYALIALRWVASLLQREDILLGLEPPPLRGSGREARGRRAIILGVAMLLFVYFVGSWLQAGSGLSLPVGLAATLWLVVFLPGIAYPLLTKQKLRVALGLRIPRAWSWSAAAALAGGLAVINSAWMQQQAQYLPMPRALLEEFARIAGMMESLDPVTAFLLLAVSPGIAEEVFWRGAFQSDLMARGKPLRAACIVGVFFGLFHFSIYRFLPTALAGFVLALLRWRTGSILPCMLFHTLYNGMSAFWLPWLLGESATAVPATVVFGACLACGFGCYQMLRGTAWRDVFAGANNCAGSPSKELDVPGSIQ